MKIFIHHLLSWHLFFLLIMNKAHSQSKGEPILYRVYEDNDFLNIRGKGTDKAYSGGTRLDIFKEQRKKPLLIPEMVTIREDSMIFMNQWGVMQMIFTPNDIDNKYFQAQDYFYAGSLFLTSSSYAYNANRKYSFQTEIEIGMRGPSAFGKETQTWVHRMIEYRLPMGWKSQLRNMPILNFNVAFEKQVAGISNWLELISGTQWRIGTLQNGISIYSLLRIGIMQSYFKGYITRYVSSSRSTGKRKIQAYLLIKPVVQWVLTNAMLQPDLFNKRNLINKTPQTEFTPLRGNDYSLNGIRHFVYSINYGAVVSTGKFAISFVQNTATEMRKDTYKHEFGNISIYFNL